ncbi:MAG: HAMP domain-containing protein [Planctomycetia bacterium]|nr:HAMP domain-containing protein [Planctomycetia bacterium]
MGGIRLSAEPRSVLQAGPIPAPRPTTATGHPGGARAQASTDPRQTAARRPARRHHGRHALGQQLSRNLLVPQAGAGAELPRRRVAACQRTRRVRQPVAAGPRPRPAGKHGGLSRRRRRAVGHRRRPADCRWPRGRIRGAGRSAARLRRLLRRHARSGVVGPRPIPCRTRRRRTRRHALRRPESGARDGAGGRLVPGHDRRDRRARGGHPGSSTDSRSDPADDEAKLRAIEPHLERLSALTAELPSFLQERLHDLSREVRTGYRTLIITTWASAMAAVMLLGALGVLTYRWVFRPLRLLGRGSRRVASGDFAYRLKLDTRDEMAELAAALNDMTMRFQEIRDDLDRQVQLRTREVIRSEQLASVGFLAAGVAHEINNPLASIAMCAESLESRLEALATDEADARVTKRYLELIQNEAFRCKGITEKLLDFSRLGEVRRQPTAVLSLAKDVADMLRHVGRFAGKAIDIEEGVDILVMVNPQEIKQVVLNLLVNALDSVEETGNVRVAVRRHGTEAMLTVTDDGCGMTEEVLEHLFEPFFTRRKAGQGTGLGLSIVHRIVADHGGRIEASSDGPGKGSTFRLSLPVAEIGAGAASQAQSSAQQANEREVDHQDQAA